MYLIACFFTVITLLIHVYAMILEMYLWTKPIGLKTFKMSLAKAEGAKVLAANQGFYNGMLAVGLLVTFFIPDTTAALAIRFYCLSFIVAVSLYGAYSVSYRILFTQGLPALLALIFGVFAL